MEFLREKYTAQSTDSNVFYRATALLFWKDFAGRYWGSDEGKSLDFENLVKLNEASYEDETPRKSAFVLFYHMNSCAQYEASTTWLLCLTFVCLIDCLCISYVLTYVLISSLSSS